MRALRGAVAALSLSWAAALPIATWAAAAPHVSAIGAGLAIAVYAVGAVVCHQLPSRSFHLGAAQMPVCARCTGVYVGAALAAIAAWVAPAVRAAPNGGGTIARARLITALGIAPTAVTLVYEWVSGVTPSNPVRAMAGLPLGAAVAWVICKVN